MNKDVIELVASKKYLIFDFDGVVLDSVDIKTNAFAKLYHGYGFDVVDKVRSHHQNNLGVSRFEKFKHYHKNYLKYDLSEMEIIELNQQFSNLIFKSILNVDEINGVMEFIKKRILEKKLCALNSATPEEELISIVKKRKLVKYFELVCGAPSSKAQNLKRIQLSYSCSFSEMIFFGDAETDFVAAEEVGVDFVGIGDQSSVLSNSKIDCLLIKDFKEIC